MAYKLGYLKGDSWTEHSYAPVFGSETTKSASKRLIVGVPRGDGLVMRALINVLEPPYYVLYVLHTARGEGVEGRYQSPLLGSAEFEAFFERFSNFLSGDARFDLWIHSPSKNATAVWERHNLIYAYGPLGEFESALFALGFQQGIPTVPIPHEHHYRAEFDTDAAELLGFFDWVRTPLRPEDEQ